MSSPRSSPSRRRSPVLPVLAAVLSAGLLAGCTGTAVTGSGSPGATTASGLQVEVATQSHDGRVDSVEIDADSGDVVLRAGPAGTAQVEHTLRWTGTKPVLTETLDGGVLRIGVRCPDGGGPGRRCEADLVVTVPAAAAARTELGSGDVTVADLAGTQQHRTSSGDVRATGLRAARTTVRTTSGNVDLGFATRPGSVEATTTAGDVRVQVPAGAGYRVDATTTAGDVTVGVAVDPGADAQITARSSAGDVTVGNP